MTHRTAWGWAACVAAVVACALQGGVPRGDGGPYGGEGREEWNRVHRSIFERVDADGVVVGGGELDPILFATSRWLLEEARAKEVEAALGGLLAEPRTIEGAPPLARAVLQRDLWAVHDWLAAAGEQRGSPSDPGDDARRREVAERLRASVADAMRALALSFRQIAALEAEIRGLESRLEPDLAQLLELEASEGGAWVRLAARDGKGVLAANHSEHFAARSAFSVHLRLPGGRGDAESYLAFLASSELTVGEGAELRLSPDVPQPPPGTAVALVRRALHVDRGGALRVLPLVENVQLRTFPRTEPPEGYRAFAGHVVEERFDGEFWRTYQAVRELELDRALLLAGSAPLREVGPGERDLASFGSHGWDPLEGPGPGFHRLRLEGCTGCHGAPGIHSVASFTGLVSGPGTHIEVPLHAPPQRLELDSSASPGERALAVARARPELARLLEAWETAGESRDER